MVRRMDGKGMINACMEQWIRYIYEMQRWIIDIIHVWKEGGIDWGRNRQNGGWVRVTWWKEDRAAVSMVSGRWDWWVGDEWLWSDRHCVGRWVIGWTCEWSHVQVRVVNGGWEWAVEEWSGVTTEGVSIYDWTNRNDPSCKVASWNFKLHSRPIVFHCTVLSR